MVLDDPQTSLNDSQIVPDDPKWFHDSQMGPDYPQMILKDSQMVQDDFQMVQDDSQMVPDNYQIVRYTILQSCEKNATKLSTGYDRL